MTTNAAAVAVPAPAPLRFPPGFLWGASTSAYQIEGALQAEGRGPTIWDRFCGQHGCIAGGDTAATACDHYRRYREDIALLAGLGVGAYRFSIAWSRIQPEGVGALNRPGLAFYSRLVDELLARGISPLPTLYHWDLPQALQDAGGWLKRDTAERFAEFAELVARQLGDRVPRWITHNETFEHTVLGHALGTHAPGLTLGLDSFTVAHHLLLSHGLAVQALRANLPAHAQVGIAQSMAPARPASGSPDDVAAAQLLQLLHEGQHCEPLLRGRYPDALAALGIDLSAMRAGDMATISQRLDFLGINYYNPNHVRATPPGSLVPLAEAEPPAQYERTEMGWPVIPDGLSELLLDLKQRYGDQLPPIVITENGAAMPDGIDDSGRVDDPRRIAYLEQHLRTLRQAMDGGVDVRGYFVWSLLDNFEWAEGYRPRFGLVHVDYATQRRTPKQSYHWYRDLIAAQR